MRGEPFLLANAHEHIGENLGVSDWVFIDQVQVNVFGEVTRWRTPGHCDPDYAKKGPYGGTIIHGFHMMSLLSHFYRDVGLWPEDGQNPLNYGLDKVRVLKPVVIGDGVRLRSHISLLDVQDKKTQLFCQITRTKRRQRNSIGKCPIVSGKNWRKYQIGYLCSLEQ